MDRQTVRQRTGTNARHRSGTSNRPQSRSANSSQASSQSRSKFQRSRPPKSASLKKRSRYSGLLLVLGLWAISLISATLAARSLLDPTVVATSSVSPATIATSTPSSSAEPSSSPPKGLPSPLTESIVPDSSDLPGAALDDQDFYQPTEANYLPFLAMGLTAISLAMSWVLMSRALRPARPIPRLEGRSTRTTAIQPTAIKQLPAATASVMPPALTAPQTSTQKANPQNLGSTASPAMVTVLPANQSSPLDWEEPSLADSLDLRQHQSLPS